MNTIEIIPSSIQRACGDDVSGPASMPLWATIIVCVIIAWVVFGCVWMIFFDGRKDRRR